MIENNKALTFLISCLTIFTVGVLLCSAAFGIGYATGQFSKANFAKGGIVSRFISPDDAETASDQGQDVSKVTPENFDVFWEALDYLEDNFDGDVPSGNDVTYAAIEGVMQHVGTCETTVDAQERVQIVPPQMPRSAPENFAFFWEAANQVYGDCREQAPEIDELVYVALNGVTARLDDDYTTVMSPQHAEDYWIDLDSTFEGIGATVVPTDEEAGTGVTIVYPFPGSPAEKNGLLQNDIVLSVDGHDVTQMNLNDAVKLIRGPAGTVVVLTVSRQDKAPFDVEITRDRIDIPIIDWEIRDDNLLYIALYDFSTRATKEVRSALEAGVEADVRGIILDLRGNPGGFLDASIDIASMFIDDGIIVSESGRENSDHRTTVKSITPTLPLVVLIDAGSASASEIVAGAIQDLGRGTLIGEQTYGKGSVQTIFNLSDGSLLRVTTARWYTPNGRLIEGEGLFPDVEIPFGTEPDQDPQLDAAVNHLLTQISSQ